MGGPFGNRRSGLERCFEASVARGVALALAALACSGSSFVVGEERPGAAGLGEDEVDGPGVVDPSEPAPDVALLEDCPPSPVERRSLLGCWPTRHVGRWRGFFIGLPRYETLDGGGAEFPRGDVLLELGVDGAGELRFGVAPTEVTASSSAPVPACGGPSSPQECTDPGLLLAGFRYRLEVMELFDAEEAPASRIAGEPRVRFGERMSFVVQVGQPWEAVCADVEAAIACAPGECARLPERPGAVEPTGGVNPEAPACRCEASGCEPRGASLSISLRLSDDGLALRGTYTPNDASLGQARLEFAKDSTP